MTLNKIYILMFVNFIDYTDDDVFYYYELLKLYHSSKDFYLLLEAINQSFFI